MTAGCIWAVPSFLRAFTQDAGLIDLGLRYAVIVFAFSTILSVDLVYEKMFQAVGRMQVTMAGLSLGCLVNIIGDPILISEAVLIQPTGVEAPAENTATGCCGSATPTPAASVCCGDEAPVSSGCCGSAQSVTIQSGSQA